MDRGNRNKNRRKYKGRPLISPEQAKAIAAIREGGHHFMNIDNKRYCVSKDEDYLKENFPSI